MLYVKYEKERDTFDDISSIKQMIQQGEKDAPMTLTKDDLAKHNSIPSQLNGLSPIEFREKAAA